MTKAEKYQSNRMQCRDVKESSLPENLTLDASRLPQDGTLKTQMKGNPKTFFSSTRCGCGLTDSSKPIQVEPEKKRAKQEFSSVFITVHFFFR